MNKQTKIYGVGKINGFQTAIESYLVLKVIERRILIVEFDISGYLDSPQKTINGNYFE